MKHPKHPNTSKHPIPKPLNPLKGTCNATANETERRAKVIDSTNPKPYNYSCSKKYCFIKRLHKKSPLGDLGAWGTCSATANETERRAKVIDSTNPKPYNYSCSKKYCFIKLLHKKSPLGDLGDLGSCNASF